MTDDTRGAIADLTLIGAALISVYFIATNPPLRRTLWRALKYGLVTGAPNLLWQETTRAWALSARNQE
jgi:hypothetical protein